MSYRGKHAAPSQRLLSVKARMAGVGIAGFATVGAGVSMASSSQADVWDNVAACESGGNWAISTGNGFYGGLQFTQSTWKAYGGGAYASSANKASKAQQIAVAQRVLAGQGPGAWPVCSRKAGLTRGNGGASSGSAVAAKPTVNQAPKVTPKPKPSVKVTSKGIVVTVTKPGATSKPSSKPWPSTMPVSKPSTGKPGKPGKPGKKVTVKAGDTLGKLAMKHHVSGGWRALYAANKGKLSSPNRIYVGQVLTLPA